MSKCSNGSDAWRSALHKALLRALDFKEWRNALSVSAEKVLKKQWQMERDVELRAFYERLTPRIVETVMGDLYDTGAWFSMTIPHATLDLAALWPDLERAASYNTMIHRTGEPGRPTKLAVMAEEGEVMPELLFPEQHENLERVRQAIRDWCAMEKNLDPERDQHKDGSWKTPDEMGERVMEILGVGHSVVPRTNLMDDAAKSLAGAIEAWLAGDPMTPGFSGKSNGTPINSSPETVRETQMGEARQYGEPAVTTLHPEVAEQWLKAVLAEWVAVVRQRLPLRIEKELDKVRREMRKALER